MIVDSTTTGTVTITVVFSSKTVPNFYTYNSSSRVAFFLIHVHLFCMKLAYDDLVKAYLDARRGKSTKPEVITRDENLQDNMKQLYDDLCTDHYQIALPIRFIIQDPVVREIIALPFRDRIVQHLVHHYLYPIFDPWFIHDSYSNRIGKGTLFGTRRVSHMMRSSSDCYTHDCYVLKMDIQSFFLSIDRHILRDLIQTKCEKIQVSWDTWWILQLVQQIIFYDYTHCITVSHPMMEALLLCHKSLLSASPGKWLPLGNLTSQLFGNIYMNQLDQYIKHILRAKYYGRYVDDFVVFHESRNQLLERKQMIYDFLVLELGLRLHPHKIYLQHYSKWVRFLGIMIKPYHTQIWPRTRSHINNLQYQARNDWGGGSSTWLLLPRINSYLWILKHHCSYHARRKLCRWLGNDHLSHLHFEDSYYKVVLSPKPLPYKYQDEYWLYALI